MRVMIRIVFLAGLLGAVLWVWRSWRHGPGMDAATSRENNLRLPVLNAAPANRVFYGHLLEPANLVLHGAGQSDTVSFEAYSKAVSPARPLLMMRYADLHDDLPRFFARMKADLQTTEDYLIPQIGISMNEGSGARHYEEAVAAGKHDAALEQLCTGIQSLDRPVFVRPGYEFNGPWNGYIATSYIAAFRHISDVLHRCQPRKAALVWNWSADAEVDMQKGGAPQAYASARWRMFYPGDEFVDWWAINLFTPRSLTIAATREFLDEAERRHFPVMVAESTLRGASIHHPQAAIDQWFTPYFNLVRSAPAIKAFCYIDWDWRIYPQWADWGDSRIESDPTVLEFYRSQVVNAPWIAGAADRTATLALLHVENK